MSGPRIKFIFWKRARHRDPRYVDSSVLIFLIYSDVSSCSFPSRELLEVSRVPTELAYVRNYFMCYNEGSVMKSVTRLLTFFKVDAVFQEAETDVVLNVITLWVQEKCFKGFVVVGLTLRKKRAPRRENWRQWVGYCWVPLAIWLTKMSCILINSKNLTYALYTDSNIYELRE